MGTIDTIPAPPPRPDHGHKGTFGTVVVVGGCPAMPGAPALCARAALRAGAGLVKVVAVADVLPTVITVTPSATGVPLGRNTSGHAAAAADALDDRSVFALGPGWGEPPAADAMLQRLIESGRPGVIDADGLNTLAGTGARLADRKSTAPLVLTPHPGEFRRLAMPLGISTDPTEPTQRHAAAVELAHAHGTVVLLKGRHTVVADGTRVFTNTTGNPALATAGSGDVLTGLLAALLAQGMDAFDAACLAAHAHGLAADHWARIYGPAGMLATDLADALPEALNSLRP